MLFRPFRGREATPERLTCLSLRSEYALTPAVAAVDNGHPDKSGPIIESLSKDPERLTLHLTARDPSGIAIGKISFSGGFEAVLYPDQFNNGTLTFDLSTVGYPGWTTVTSLLLVDRNGMATMLRIPETPRLTSVTSEYELITADGRVVPSGIATVTYLNPNRQRGVRHDD